MLAMYQMKYQRHDTGLHCPSLTGRRAGQAGSRVRRGQRGSGGGYCRSQCQQVVGEPGPAVRCSRVPPGEKRAGPDRPLPSAQGRGALLSTSQLCFADRCSWWSWWPILQGQRRGSRSGGSGWPSALLAAPSPLPAHYAQNCPSSSALTPTINSWPSLQPLLIKEKLLNGPIFLRLTYSTKAILKSDKLASDKHYLVGITARWPHREEYSVTALCHWSK